MLENDNEIEHVDDLIVDMVVASYENLQKPRIRETKEQLPTKTFFNEFKHLKIKCQRQAGHTTAAMHLLFKFPNSVVFVPSELIRTELVRHMTWMYHTQYPQEYLVKGDTNGAVEHRREKRFENIDRYIHDHILSAQGSERLHQKLIADYERTYANLDLVIVDVASRFDFLAMEGLYHLLGEKTKLFVELQ